LRIVNKKQTAAHEGSSAWVDEAHAAGLRPQSWVARSHLQRLAAQGAED